MQKLRDEIIESEKARSDLLKWKLIIVSALAAVAFGLSLLGVPNPVSSQRNAHRLPNPHALALVPFVSLYVDILCYHLALRMIVIGAFLRQCNLIDGLSNSSNSLATEVIIFKEYEKFAASRRDKKNTMSFNLEDAALVWSTVSLSVIVCMFGFFYALDYCTDKNNSYNLYVFVALIVAGIIGIILAFIVYYIYCKKTAALDQRDRQGCNSDQG